MVSVIIPNYNHASYLKKRIDSVLEQTYQNFELIILDDKSSDNSKEIIEEYRNDPRVSHIIYNAENSGSTFYQWNKGVSLAKGKYIWIAESDDYADPTLIETLLNNIKEDENITLAFCQSYRVNKDSMITGDWHSHTKELDKNNIFENDFIMDGIQFIKDFLITKNVIPNASGIIFRKDAYESVGGASTNIGYIGDWLMWLKILSIGEISYSSKKLNYFRYHEKSVVAKAYNTHDLFYKRYSINVRILYNRFLSENKIDKFLLSINKDKLEDEVFEEFRFLKSHKRYRACLKYYILALKYSSNKRSILYKSLKAIFIH